MTTGSLTCPLHLRKSGQAYLWMRLYQPNHVTLLLVAESTNKNMMPYTGLQPSWWKSLQPCFFIHKLNQRFQIPSDHSGCVNRAYVVPSATVFFNTLSISREEFYSRVPADIISIGRSVTQRNWEEKLCSVQLNNVAETSFANAMISSGCSASSVQMKTCSYVAAVSRYESESSLAITTSSSNWKTLASSSHVGAKALQWPHLKKAVRGSQRCKFTREHRTPSRRPYSHLMQLRQNRLK